MQVTRASLLFIKIAWTLLRPLIIFLQFALPLLSEPASRPLYLSLQTYGAILGVLCIILLVTEHYYEGPKFKSLLVFLMGCDAILQLAFLPALFPTLLLLIISLVLILHEGLLIFLLLKRKKLQQRAEEGKE